MKQIAKKVLTIVAMIAGISIMSSNGFAESSKAVIKVSATVQARIWQTLVRQEKVLSITNEQAAKGYMDIPAATLIQIKTNDPNGYMLSFEVDAEMVKEVWVIDSKRTTILSGGGGFVHQAYPGPSGEVKEISYRFFLAPGTQPGVYAWPLSLTASLP